MNWNDFTFDTGTTMILVVLLIFSSITVIEKGIESFRRIFFSKGTKSTNRITEIEKKQQRDYNRMNAFDTRLDAFEERVAPIEDGMKQQCIALKALLHHGVTGNSTDKLQNAEKDLDDWLINR